MLSLVQGPLRVAVVGMGEAGIDHASRYNSDGRARVVAVCDRDGERARAAGERFDCAAFTSVPELLAAGLELGGATVATRGSEGGGDHCEPVLQLIEARVPVLVEVPLAADLGQSREMVSAARARRLPLGVNLNHRFTPAARLARRWLDEGKLGELNLANITLWIPNPEETAPHHHLRALHQHSIDVLRYFAGEIRSVHALFKRGAGRATWSNVQLNLLFVNGVVGHLTGSYDAGIPYGFVEWFEMAGSEGRVTIEDACRRLTFQPRQEDRPVELYNNLGGMRTYHDTFQWRISVWIEDLLKRVPADRIEGAAEEALRAQYVIEAAIRSWEERREVEVVTTEE